MFSFAELLLTTKLQGRKTLAAMYPLFSSTSTPAPDWNIITTWDWLRIMLGVYTVTPLKCWIF